MTGTSKAARRLDDVLPKNATGAIVHWKHRGYLNSAYLQPCAKPENRWAWSAYHAGLRPWRKGKAPTCDEAVKAANDAAEGKA